ncbi:uncharacterized protein LOC108212690 [Daucus carota subsp. sativus]|uniref:uncharacterized protein LOC108212690 n=1 Tax=Daucus carota subsp. sativus TaxID=79200 RepID=UPI0007EFFB49|nr:PREDICTED: uncharacterized protein LOC108212690 [Daucus carota subsp. sativus]
MTSNNLSISIALFKGDNYHSWAIKMKEYMKALNLWDVIESDTKSTPLPRNPTSGEIKKHEEEMARKPKALSCSIQRCLKRFLQQSWVVSLLRKHRKKIKEEFKSNQQTKLMQILNLKRELEIMGMKSNEGVEEYGSRLISIVNQIKLLGGEFSSQRVVDKLLVTLPEWYETKISSHKDIKDLSKLTVSELINSLLPSTKGDQ